MKIKKRNINEVYEDFHRAQALEARFGDRFKACPTPENFEKYKRAKMARVYNEEIINRHKAKFWDVNPWEVADAK